MSISSWTWERFFSKTTMAKMDVPAETLPVRAATALVAVMPVPGVAFRRADQAAGLQRAGWIQQLCAGLRQPPRLRAGGQHPGHDVPQLPWEAVGGDVALIEVQLGLVIVHGVGIDGEHARGVAHTQHLLPGQLPVDVACQGE